MDLGICVRDLPANEVARLGRFAEDHGFSHVFVPDVRGGGAEPGKPLGGRDAFASLGAMFEATSTVRGAVGVAAVIFHEPTTLARMAGTLNELSGGRFDLGIGVSHPEAAGRRRGHVPDVAADRDALVGRGDAPVLDRRRPVLRRGLPRPRGRPRSQDGGSGGRRRPTASSSTG